MRTFDRDCRPGRPPIGDQRLLVAHWMTSATTKTPKLRRAQERETRTQRAGARSWYMVSLIHAARRGTRPPINWRSPAAKAPVQARRCRRRPGDGTGRAKKCDPYDWMTMTAPLARHGEVIVPGPRSRSTGPCGRMAPIQMAWLNAMVDRLPLRPDEHLPRSSVDGCRL